MSAPMFLWKPTTLWQPGRTGTASAGSAVRCEETGELGFCKKTYVANEKICADLARHVDVLLPDFRLGRLEGHPTIVGISVAHGTESMDLRMLSEQKPQVYQTPEVQRAIRAASGVLPFHAWVRNEDVKDDHLVIADDGRGGFAVAAIDFSYALRWGSPDDGIDTPAPPAVLAHLDKPTVVATLERIEACSDEEIKRTYGAYTRGNIAGVGAGAYHTGSPGTAFPSSGGDAAERVAIMTHGTIKWARVEYQRDLRDPQPPVPLGIVVVAMDAGLAQGVVLGREPRRESSPPAELKSVGPLGLAQLHGWVSAVARDAQEAQRLRREPFEFLCSRWRWNLYVMEVDLDAKAPDETLLDVAERLYKRHMNEPFQSAVRRTFEGDESVRWRAWSPAEVEYASPA